MALVKVRASQTSTSDNRGSSVVGTAAARLPPGALRKSPPFYEHPNHPTGQERRRIGVGSPPCGYDPVLPRRLARALPLRILHQD